MSVFDIRDFGARQDEPSTSTSTSTSTPVSTSAIVQAIAACTAEGGGTVLVPPGRYYSAPVQLRDNVTLRLEGGAELCFLPDFSLYQPVQSRWEGVECFALHPLVFATGATNVSIEGDGVLNGNGGPWWDEFRRRRASGQSCPVTAQDRRLADKNPGYETHSSGGGGRETQFLRPPLVQFYECRRVRIRDVTCVDPPFWNVHLVYCRDVTVEGVSFQSPEDAPNTDGLNLDSCRDVIVTRCRFSVGDDCLGLKSGAGDDGMRVARPTENVVISDCLMERGHGGVVIGSETAGGIRNVSVTNCVFRGTDRGIRIKTRRGRGGTVERIAISSIVMEDVLAPIVVNMFYRCGLRDDEQDLLAPGPREIDPATPAIDAISIRGITAGGVRASAGYFCGLPERPLCGLSISDVYVVLSPDASETPADAAMAEGPPEPTDPGVYTMWTSGETISGIVVRRPNEG